MSVGCGGPTLMLANLCWLIVINHNCNWLQQVREYIALNLYGSDYQ